MNPQVKEKNDSDWIIKNKSIYKHNMLKLQKSKGKENI